MTRTLLLSTVMLGAWTAAALAEPAAVTTTPTTIATSQQVGLIELNNAQMDKITAGYSYHSVYNNGNDYNDVYRNNSYNCHNC